MIFLNSKQINLVKNFNWIWNLIVFPAVFSLNDYAGFGGGSMPSLFRALCNRINTQQKLDKVRNFALQLLFHFSVF